MERVSFDYSRAMEFITEDEIRNIQAQTEAARLTLVEGTGAGNDYIGWVDLPVNYDKEEFARILKAARKIQSDSEILVVIGIGGSYLGARAAISFLGNSLTGQGKGCKILYAGNSISGSYLHDLMESIGDADWSINVISKSGTTTEPAIAFRILKAKLEERYGKAEAAKRIYATTDRRRGALKTLADSEGYETFVVPDDVGGRFSVLTAVGLLPIAAAGFDIQALMDGANEARTAAIGKPFAENDALLYAAVRNILLRKGLLVEVMTNYEPALHYVAEWWKQLAGESEGKDQRGIFPASMDLTTDLHSLGQFLQDGSRIFLETVLQIVNPTFCVEIPGAEEDLDGLNYLAGSDMDFANKSAMNGTILAHTDGRVPNLRIDIPFRNEHCLGQLFYFFEFAVGVSGYMLGVNPFNQPGVESYKKNMFTLLGKPGYEDGREALLERLK